MKFVDLHSDTFYKLYYEKNKCENIENNSLHIDLEKLKKADSFIQTFAIFDQKERTHYKKNKVDAYIEFALNVIKKNESKISIIKSYDDITREDGKQKILLGIEDLGYANGSLDNVKSLYDRGFRIYCVLWNHENSIGYPNLINRGNEYGLKAFGKEVIEFLNEIGGIVDVSHLNDVGTYDVLDISNKPVIASHSNARDICFHSRNLTDDIIKKIANSGGVIGINFLSLFLDGTNYSKKDYIIKHAKYIKNVGGSDVLAFGTDFDGIDCELEIEDISGIQTLIPLLENAGFTNKEIEKMYYQNAIRVFKEVL